MKNLKNTFVLALLFILLLPFTTKAYTENINIDISKGGVVPAFSVVCIGTNATALLIAEPYPFQKSVEAYMRRPCINGQADFDSFDLNAWLERMGGQYPSWNTWFNTKLLLVVKDTTTLYAPDAPIYGQIINLWGSQNNYSRGSMDPDDNFYPTLGVGPSLVFDGTEWLNEHKVVAGNSNIMFFPGVMGSRLYEQVGSVDCSSGLSSNDCIRDNELWVSTVDSNHLKMALDSNGKSLNNLYTKDDTQNNGELDETGLVDDAYSANIYESFISDLRKWKNDDKIINDYAFIPYDWRLSLQDIITNGASTTAGNLSYTTAQNFSESYILKKLRELQKSSNSKKVTLIAHSNGGLVVKALMQKLEETNDPLYNQIDKIILIAVPQVGTPDAVVGILHGSDLGHGYIMNNEVLRFLAQNMSTVYNGLPSSSYFSVVDQGFVIDSVISFESDPLLSNEISKYGNYIIDPTVLKNYILGTDGRSAPAFKETDSPGIGNQILYNKAEILHKTLDAWQPASTTKVIQIAGWGEETLAGLDYKVYKHLIGLGTKYVSFKPRMVVDGDGTVVTPSALWMSTSTPNVERWWVNLDKYNSVFSPNLSRNHRDILEISNIKDLIKSSIVDLDYSDSTQIITRNIPFIESNAPHLHYVLHSPLTLGISDPQGHYSGQDPVTKEVKLEIPGVIYKQIGNVKYISVPESLAHTLKLKGYDNGEFALDIEKQQGNNVSEKVSFQGVPSSITTVVSMNYVPGQIIASSTLSIDQNGDGVSDKTLKSVGEETVLYDDIAPEVTISFSTTTREVVFDGGDSSPVVITKSNASTTVVDSQGNKTVLIYTEYKKKNNEFELSFNKISRNNAITVFPSTSLEYEWSEKNGVLTDLDTSVIIKGVKQYSFEYKKSTNTTIVKEKNKTGVVTRTVKGFVVVTLKTEGGDIKVNY